MIEPACRTPILGVVVIGRNEGERLRACFESIDRTIGPVVYVDSGSTDGSVALAENLGVAVVVLDTARPFTAARARNAGFARLRDLAPSLAFVQFMDGDCALAPGWLGEAHTSLSARRDVAVVCGRRRERHPERSVFNRLCDLEWDTAPGEALECGGDFLVRTEAFAAVGGFDGGLIAGEEPELCVRLRARGWRIWRLDAEMTLHDANITSLRQWWWRMVRSGHAFAQVARVHRGSPHAIWRAAVPRAVFWGVGLPVLSGLGVFVHPAAALLTLLYPVQLCRIARRRSVAGRGAWAYAGFTLLGKLPEVFGIATFYANRMSRRSAALIEYK
ncbi:glycosyltransferase family 2 protein [Methylobacterium sp. Leaf112]|uniref:glycosyltransferase family 2 protein n=1 Tax=Methylobacterium sp. Leaf112 TaxID=1736258 RepID=UPI0006F2BE9F|nr:glycosyltransferase [Methylobacterium sp. Leaf112]KQP70859.1 glycosyl transferase [Methylobacterium sp. Leaf112]